MLLHWLVAELRVCVLACLQLARARQGRSAYVTPRHYLVSRAHPCQPNLPMVHDAVQFDDSPESK